MGSDDSEYLDELEHEIGELGAAGEEDLGDPPQTALILDLDGCLHDWRPLVLPEALAGQAINQDRRIQSLADLLNFSALPLFYMSYQPVRGADALADWIERVGLPSADLLLLSEDSSEAEVPFKVRAVSKAVAAVSCDSAFIISTKIHGQLSVKYKQRGWLHVVVIDPMVMH